MNGLLLDCEDVAWYRDELTGARGAAAALARRIGLSEHRAGEVALAVSEVATNLAKHAVDGSLLLRVLRTDRYAAVEFLALDAGPGITDLPAVMRDGISSVGTLGIGLGAITRLADTFDIYTLPGQGTVVTGRFWPRDDQEFRADAAGGRLLAGELAVAGVTRPISGERVCGDAWAARRDDGTRQVPPEASGPGAGSAVGQSHWSLLTATRTAAHAPSPSVGDPGLLVMLCDGLGHGPMAALAGQAAVQAFQAGRGQLPEEVIGEVHRALKGSRGAAVAVARIEPDQDRVLFCGVGNIAAALIDTATKTSLPSVPGIVGHQMRGLRTFTYPLPASGALVMHSDGLSERWTTDALPGFLSHNPGAIAGQLLRHAGAHRDDAGIVIAKSPW
ncbi:ATP-binding protein [Streptacidiphilus sp. PAMC 29251]